ncbi:MAG: VacB/RNase II family 3'-5' exoribonuclease [Myxococcota bacterium]|nr:VacB/RNase II family 3'-5' exoribonuclease [Myxococcota bacterium]
MLGRRELVRRLGLIRGQVPGLQALLRRLEKDGVLERVGGRFRRGGQSTWIEGLLEFRADGVPCLRDGHRLLPLGDVADAREGDRIRVQPLGPSGSAGFEFIELVEGARTSWLGTVDRGRRGHMLLPYRGREGDAFPIASADLCGAQVGELVEAEPVGEVYENRRPGMRVVERLGQPGEAEADFRAVVWHRRLPTDFSVSALAEAEEIPEQIGARELEKRLDLRDRCFVTIDPEGARDHDDALFVETTSSGSVRLWVAIADVSHFVQPGSELYRAAWLRGNSVYFPACAIPMLPERISSDLCSLRPGVDRLVVAVQLEVDREGEVRKSAFHPAVIRSRRGLSYPDAAADVGGAPGPEVGSGQPDAVVLEAEVREQLRALGEVTGRLARRRRADSSLDFDLPEPEVVLGKDGRPTDIRRAERGPAHRAVEEAMLACNRAVAEALLNSRQPSVFRIHEPPSSGDLYRLGELYRAFGYQRTARGTLLDRPGIARALEASSGRPEENLVQYSSLRSMKQARYSAESSGHFALGFAAYLHFTSPIRRYADLVVHRSLRGMLGGRSFTPDQLDWTERVAIRTSARERAAVAAEREMIALARCSVMRDRVGEAFMGTVSGVAEHGLYVTLDAPFVEGRVAVSTLSGFFDHDAERHRLVARGSRRQYRIGERLEVNVVSVNMQRGWIDMEIVPKSRGKGSPDDAVRKPATRRPASRKKRGKPGRGRGPRFGKRS